MRSCNSGEITSEKGQPGEGIDFPPLSSGQLPANADKIIRCLPSKIEGIGRTEERYDCSSVSTTQECQKATSIWKKKLTPGSFPLLESKGSSGLSPIGLVGRHGLSPPTSSEVMSATDGSTRAHPSASNDPPTSSSSLKQILTAGIDQILTAGDNQILTAWTDNTTPSSLEQFVPSRAGGMSLDQFVPTGGEWVTLPGGAGVPPPAASSSTPRRLNTDELMGAYGDFLPLMTKFLQKRLTEPDTDDDSDSVKEIKEELGDLKRRLEMVELALLYLPGGPRASEASISFSDGVSQVK